MRRPSVLMSSLKLISVPTSLHRLGVHKALSERSFCLWLEVTGSLYPTPTFSDVHSALTWRWNLPSGLGLDMRPPSDLWTRERSRSHPKSSHAPRPLGSGSRGQLDSWVELGTHRLHLSPLCPPLTAGFIPTVGGGRDQQTQAGDWGWSRKGQVVLP